MSAWIIALGLAAGYLVNKKLLIEQQIEEKVSEFNSAAEEDENLPTAEIRRVKRTVPDADKYEDMNVADLSASDARKLVDAREGAWNEVQDYERGPGPIQGVYLVMGRDG